MKRKDSLRKVYKDYVLYLYHLDPYLINDAFEYGESAERFAKRVSKGMTAADVLKDISYTREQYLDNDEDGEILVRLDEFEDRVKALAC